MTSLEAARELLPTWLQLVAGLPLLAIGFGIGLLTTGLASWVARVGIRRTAEQHWTATASALYPARQVAAISTWMCVAFAVASLTQLVGPLCPIPMVPMGVLIGLATLWGCALPAARIVPAPAFRKGTLAHLRSLFVSLLFVNTGPFVVAAMLLLLGPRLDDARNVGIAILGFLAYTISVVWGGSLPLARVLGLLRPPSERLRAAVERASQRTQVVPRAVFEIDLPVANAFALVVPGWLVFTTGCSALEDRELEAITRHELGHLSEPRAVVFARVLAGYRLFPVAFLSALSSTLGGTALVGLGALFLALHFAQRALSRRMEIRADRLAQMHEDDPGVYALALEHLHALNLAPVVPTGANATHPALDDRLKQAGVEPSWPRPRPPSSSRMLVGLCVAAVVVCLALVSSLSLQRAENGERPLQSILIWGGGANDLYTLGAERSDQGDREGAVILYRAAADLAPQRPFYRAQLAQELAFAARCDESRVELEPARTAAAGNGDKLIDVAMETIARLCAAPAASEP